MKIIVTGSLGYIGKPLTEDLIKKGHSLTVISSQTGRKKEIEALGAKAAIGTVEDINFLTDTFTGADAVYCMLAAPGNSFTDPNFKPMEYSTKIASNYVRAIGQSGVKHIVYLSSIGAHTDKGNGLLALHYYAEKTLNQLPPDVSITFMRPVGFYKNLNQFAEFVKGKGFLGAFLALRTYGLLGMIGGKRGVIMSNYGENDMSRWASSLDIASAITEELETPSTGRKVRYVTSDELTCNEVARILGEAVGKPYLKWGVISSKQLLSGMKRNGMPSQIAEGLVEMNESIRSGKIYEDYNRNNPKLGKVKMTDYAKEFAKIYNKK